MSTVKNTEDLILKNFCRKQVSNIKQKLFVLHISADTLLQRECKVQYKILNRISEGNEAKWRKPESILKNGDVKWEMKRVNLNMLKI